MPSGEAFGPVLLGVPCQEWTWTDAECARAQLIASLPPGSAVCYMQGRHSIAWKRNELVRTLLADPSLEALCFLDSDAVPGPDAVHRLLAHGVAIVAALNFMRRPPHLPASAFPDRPAESELQDVAHAATHCMLVRRHVFEAMPDPWFDHGDTPGEGEDVWFCHQARAHGFRVYVDYGYSVGHLASPLNVDRDYVRIYNQTPAGQAARARFIREHTPA